MPNLRSARLWFGAILAAAALVLTPSVAALADDAPPPTPQAPVSTAGPDAQPGTTSQVTVDNSAPAPAAAARGVAPLAAAAAANGDDDLTTITFSDHYGETITSQYEDQGIRFGGSSPFITGDGANPTSPVLSGAPQFYGAIRGTFIDEDGLPRPVDTLKLDVGYIDTSGSVEVVILGLDGTPVQSVPVNGTGIVTVTVRQPNIGGFLVQSVAGYSDAFAIDNVSFTSAVPFDAELILPQYQAHVAGEVAGFYVNGISPVDPGHWWGNVTSGPNTGTQFELTCPTDTCLGPNAPPNGTYRGTGGNGTDKIRVFHDLNGNHVRDLGEDASTLTVLWTAPIHMVGLGDSYSAGEGVNPYESGTDTLGKNLNQCHRSTRAWSKQVLPPTYTQPIATVAAQTPSSTFNFVACSGATTDSMLRSGQGQRNGHEVAQLASGWLTANTNLVTLTVSGNDVGFAPLLTLCATHDCTNPNLLKDGRPIKQYAEDKLTQAKPHIAAVMNEIKRQAPNATVVLLGYPHLFPDGIRQTCGQLLPWGETGEQDMFNNVDDDLSSALSQVAADTGVFYVPVAQAFSGHEICGASSDWINAITAPNIFDIFRGGAPVGTGSFHPNVSGVTYGYAATLDAFLADAAATRPLNAAGLPVNPAPANVPAALARLAPQARKELEAQNSDEDLPPLSDLGTLTVTPMAGDAATACYPTDGLIRAHGTFRVNGEGFTPGAPVTVTWQVSGAADQVLATLTADDGGAIDATIAAPAGAAVDSSGLVTAAGAGDDAPLQLLALAGVARPCPGTDVPAVVSATSVTLTNDFSTVGDSGDLHVTGDYTCNSNVHISGDVIATGKVSLTNTCRIDGQLRAGGAVAMTATAQVGGNVEAGGPVTFQSTNRIGGYVHTAKTFTVIDKVPVATLVTRGTLAGPVVEHATIDPVTPTLWTPASYDTTAGGVVTWRTWMNQTAAANSAPSWSAGLGPNPGCVMAPWAASVNAPTVNVVTPTVLDARKITSGCASVSLQQMTLNLAADLTIYADSFAAVNGLHVISSDHTAHALRILVPSTSAACSSATGVSLSAGTVVDPLITTAISTPGRVTFAGTSALSGQVVAGCVSSSGKVTLTAATP